MINVPTSATKSVTFLLRLLRLEIKRGRTFALIQNRPTDALAVVTDRPLVGIGVAAEWVDTNNGGTQLLKPIALKRRDKPGDLDNRLTDQRVPGRAGTLSWGSRNRSCAKSRAHANQLAAGINVS